MLGGTRERLSVDGAGAAHFEFMAQVADLILVVLLHLELILFQLIDLVTDELHLLYLLRDLRLHLLRATALALEFRPQLIEDFIQSTSVRRRLTRPQIGLAPVLRRIEHGGRRGVCSRRV